uniref:MRP-S28 domain-containing protein n=1 Tax=Globodera pallida TaxID=36090 RepID=A0A183BTE8_GLOPA
MSSPNANAVGEVASKFNKLYIMPPNRLTRIKKTMNFMFGRTGDEQRLPSNLLARTAERSPRREDMKCTQDWPSVWPAAQPFRSSTVPLPLWMGFRRRPDVQPRMGSYGNLELLKIPNFLHLTPLHVQRHSQAIKKFCTKFPEELKKASTKEQYTPLRLVYSDYIHQSTNIRDIRAREVTAHLRLDSFELKDTHAHNKCRQLLGDRYNEETDTFTIKSDRCPLRRQNIDYLSYVLTALFHESHRTEQWETSMVQELLALKEQERLDAEGEPESDRQAQLMMDRN